jgi:hypothetical protein
MELDNFKAEFVMDRSRHGAPLGVLAARMAILFAIVCTVATLVMLAS